MAIQSSYFAVAEFIDSRSQSSAVRVRIPKAKADLWYNAADATARAATDVGLLFNALNGLSSAYMYKTYVVLEDEQDAPAVPAPDSNIYNFDKLGVSFRAGLDNYSMTIPARSDANYTVNTDGVSVILGATGTAQVQDFVTRFQANVLAKNGGTPVVTKITVVR